MYRINNFDFVFFLFSLVKVCPLLSPSPPSPPLPLLLSVGASPSLSPSLRLCASYYLAAERYLEFTHAGSGHSRGNFSALPGRLWGGGGRGGEAVAKLVAALALVAGELLAALGGNTWQTRDPSGKKGGAATLVNVLIVTDSQHACRSLERAVGGMGVWGGAYWAFIPLSVPVCLPYLFLSLPGREREAVLRIPGRERKNDFI